MDDIVSRGIMTSSAALYQRQVSGISRPGRLRAASQVSRRRCPERRISEGNNKPGLDKSLNAWRQDEWKRIRGPEDLD
jgi:hypothetical protein